MLRFAALGRLRRLTSLLLVSATAAHAGEPSKRSSDLAKLQSLVSTVPVIIQFKEAPSAKELAVLKAIEGQSMIAMPSINAVELSVPVGLLTSIESNPNVKYMSLDRKLSTRWFGPPAPTTSAPTSIATSAEYTVEPINAPAVWVQGYFGTGIGVAVIDSGISPVKDLQALTAGSRVVYTQDFTARRRLQPARSHRQGLQPILTGTGLMWLA